ncbi:hypothetical protein J4Q44_G00115760 [Coregonus suidteri]|uniref:Uncharacterized protein n=1 Tax=Coregonus suidteri TaxID=861788 RepID=A0AAN8LTZ8_9TELE
MWMPPSSSQEQQTDLPTRLDLTPLLAQPQPSQLHSSAPATPAATGDTDLRPPAVQLQSQQSSAVVFNLPAAPVPTTLAMKGDTFEDSQLDTDLPCTPALPDILTQKCIHWAYQD